MRGYPLYSLYATLTHDFTCALAHAYGRWQGYKHRRNESNFITSVLWQRARVTIMAVQAFRKVRARVPRLGLRNLDLTLWRRGSAHNEWRRSPS